MTTEPSTVEPGSLTLDEIAPFVDPTTGLGIQLAIEKRNVAILTQRVAELEADQPQTPTEEQQP